MWTQRECAHNIHYCCVEVCYRIDLCGWRTKVTFCYLCTSLCADCWAKLPLHHSLAPQSLAMLMSHFCSVCIAFYHICTSKPVSMKPLGRKPAAYTISIDWLQTQLWHFETGLSAHVNTPNQFQVAMWKGPTGCLPHACTQAHPCPCASASIMKRKRRVWK